MRGGDARDHRVEAGQLFAQITQFRLLRRDVHVAAQIVDGHDLMAALSAASMSRRAKELRIAGEKAIFMAAASLPSSGRK